MLELSGLTRRFTGGGGIEDLSLRVGNDELVALLGPSGCGKTTALRLIAGLLEPEAGSVRLGGVDVTNVPPEKRDIGFVFQNYALFPHLSAAGNVAYGLKARGLGRVEIEERVRKALMRVQLEAAAARRPDELSGGEQQRIALARALVIEPRALLLDEPFSNLDASLRRELRDQLRQLRRETGIPALHVTHDQEEALALADRIAVIQRGRLVQCGTPEEVFHGPRTAFVARFLGGTNVLAATIVESDASGLTVELAGGHRISGIRRRSEALGARPGPRCSVAIRPEEISFSQDSGSGLPATIRSLTYLGSTIEIHVDAGKTALVVRLPSRGARTGLVPGSAVALVIPPDSLHVMEPEA